MWPPSQEALQRHCAMADDAPALAGMSGSRRKGRSWLLLFLFSMFLFFPALILADLARDRRSLADSTA
jgi:hypothetical protein